MALHLSVTPMAALMVVHRMDTAVQFTTTIILIRMGRMIRMSKRRSSKDRLEVNKNRKNECIKTLLRDFQDTF